MTTTHHGSNLSGISSNGGVTRFTAGQDEAPAHNPMAEAHTGLRIGGTITRTNMETGHTVDEQRFARHSAYDDQRAAERAAAQGGSIARTFEVSNGGTVMVEGMRTSVANALRQGLIEVGSDGRPRDLQRGSDWQVAPGSKAPEAASLAPQDHFTPADTSDHFDSEDMEAFDAAIEPLTQGAYESTVAAATVAVLDGASLDGAINRLAREQGGDIEHAREVVQGAYDLHRNTVARALAEVGVDRSQTAEFFDWARTKPRQLHEAIGSLMAERSTRHFQAMGREWVAYQTRHGNRQGNA